MPLAMFFGSLHESVEWNMNKVYVYLDKIDRACFCFVFGFLEEGGEFIKSYLQLTTYLVISFLLYSKKPLKFQKIKK